MKKYRIKTNDHTLLDFIIPLGAFNIINGTNIDYYVQIYKGIRPFGKWETLYTTNSKSEAYVWLMKEKYNIDIPIGIEWNWNKKYEWFNSYANLNIRQLNYSCYKYQVGYINKNNSKYHEYVISDISFEDALIKLNEHLKNLKYKHDFEKIKK